MIIKRLSFKLNTDIKTAQTLPADVSRLFHQTLKHDFTQLFQRLNPSYPISIPNLKLDLGSLPMIGWKDLLRKRLLKELETQISKQLPSNLSPIIQQPKHNNHNDHLQPIPLQGRLTTNKPLIKQPVESSSPSASIELTPLLHNYWLTGYISPELRPILAKLKPHNSNQIEKEIEQTKKIKLVKTEFTSTQHLSDIDNYYLDVEGVGLVLLWILLPNLFHQWKLVEEGKFIDLAAKETAICRLDAWIWQDQNLLKEKITITRWLCDWPMNQNITQEYQNQAFANKNSFNDDLDKLVLDITKSTSQLASCGVNEIRSWFLQRSGKLYWKDNHWQLAIEKESCDILLTDFPWPMSQITLPWLAVPLPLDWL